MSVYLDDPCPARGPGLLHTQLGIPGTPCVECGAPVYPRPTFAKAGSRVALRSLFATLTPVAEVVVTEDTEELHSVCRCYPCVHPNATNADVRAIHHVRHRDFDAWLADREAAVLAGMGVPKAEEAE